jgi:hypothetical protein
MAAVALVVGCEAPAPIGPPNPEQVAVKATDLPGGLKTCPGSGAIDGYLAAVRTKDPDSYASLSDAWATLKSKGADAAAITAFADDTANCSGLLGAGKGKSASSFVIRYQDSGSATTAFKKGILQFPTPNASQQTPGLTAGVATGLGVNSWTFEQTANGRTAFIAFWQSGQFDLMVLVADLNPSVAKHVAEAVASRAR